MRQASSDHVLTFSLWWSAATSSVLDFFGIARALFFEPVTQSADISGFASHHFSPLFTRLPLSLPMEGPQKQDVVGLLFNGTRKCGLRLIVLLTGTQRPTSARWSHFVASTSRLYSITWASTMCSTSSA